MILINKIMAPAGFVPISLKSDPNFHCEMERHLGSDFNEIGVVRATPGACSVFMVRYFLKCFDKQKYQRWFPQVSHNNG